MCQECFLKSFKSFGVFITYQNYANAELDKTELLMNLKITLSTEIEYNQEIWDIKKNLKTFQNMVAIF